MLFRSTLITPGVDTRCVCTLAGVPDTLAAMGLSVIADRGVMTNTATSTHAFGGGWMDNKRAWIRYRRVALSLARNNSSSMDSISTPRQHSDQLSKYSLKTSRPLTEWQTVGSHDVNIAHPTSHVTGCLVCGKKPAPKHTMTLPDLHLFIWVRCHFCNKHHPPPEIGRAHV